MMVNEEQTMVGAPRTLWLGLLRESSSAEKARRRHRLGAPRKIRTGIS